MICWLQICLKKKRTMKLKPLSTFLFCMATLSLAFFASCRPVVLVATLTPISSNTPPAGVTVVLVPGDLGWGAVHGKIIDGITSLPIQGVTVKCEHSSYTSPSLCKGIATTNADGIYSFDRIFFHDTDRITLFVEATGYTPARFEQSFFTRPAFRADLKLFPATGDTPTPTSFLMCTPPSCSGGVFACGDPNGCPGGCGTICLTPTP
jgi:hypothetical protein